MRLRKLAIGLALLLGSEGATAQMPELFADDDIWLMDDPTPTAPENTPTQRTTSWEDPDPGERAATGPLPAVEAVGRRDCREFQKTVIIGGRPQRAHGTVCRRHDGAWQVIRGGEAEPEP
jgi:surface antigen